MSTGRRGKGKKAAPGGAGGLGGTTSPKLKRKAGDPSILRRKTRYPDFDGSNALEVVDQAMRRAETPAGRARKHLVNILGPLGIDPLIVASPTHHALVQLLADLLHESEPDDDLDDIFEPLVALIGETTGQRAAERRLLATQERVAANLDAVAIAYFSLDESQRKSRGRVGIVKGLLARASPPVDIKDEATILGYLRMIETIAE